LNSSTDEAIALEVSNLNACDVSTDYTDSEEANVDKKDESLHSSKAEEKQQVIVNFFKNLKNLEFGTKTLRFTGKKDLKIYW
jgi:hypothetical protein